MPLSAVACTALRPWGMLRSLNICSSVWRRSALLLTLLLDVQGRIIEGELLPQKSYQVFVGKFCFDYWKGQKTVGRVQLELFRDRPAPGRSPQDGKLYLMIFDDEKSHWKQIQKRWDRSSCEEKQQWASLATEINMNSVNLTDQYTVKITEHIRPRFWYFSFVSCGGPLRSDGTLRYSVHLTNDMWGWQSEFSLDHVGLVTVYGIFTCAFVLATLGTLMLTRGNPVRREHPYVQLLLLSLVASSASCACFLVHYAIFVHNGFGSQRIRFMGVLAAIVANCTVFLVAVLASTGFAISSSRLPHRRMFLGAVSLVGGLSALCELHAEVTLDESTKLYSYQSGPGVLALILKLFMFCWFAYQIKIAFEDEAQEQKRRFYKFLGISFTGWALNVPVTVILAFLLSPWYRYKIVTTVDVISRFLGQALLLQIFCGPLSPISHENSYPTSDDGGPDTGFGRLTDGVDMQRMG